MIKGNISNFITQIGIKMQKTDLHGPAVRIIEGAESQNCLFLILKISDADLPAGLRDTVRHRRRFRPQKW
jgi:hypothetical protein